MNKRSADMSWKAMFDVRLNVHTNPATWDIVNIHNLSTVGSYREQNYAVKQARRKYKKFIKLMEKSLMSIDSN